MDLTYHCKHCGQESQIPAEKFMEQNSIICPLCGMASGNTADKSTPVERFDPTLNVEQEQAATYDGPASGILLLAGAGCGKTRTMIARALFLMKVKKVMPERLAMMTFTRRAAKEIEERFDHEIPGVSKRAFIGTFHKFCLGLMHRYANFFDMTDMKILDRNDQEVLLRKVRGELRHPETGEHIAGTSLVPKAESLIGIFSLINNKAITVSDYFIKYPPEHEQTEALVSQAFTKYNEYKRNNGYLDFDDILCHTARMLETEADFRRSVQNSMDYLLIDEMQDTSPVQWSIIKSLYPAVRIFCVGDDAQSIYSFRGADFESVHNFCSILPNSIKLKLTENYRSTQRILDVANALLADSPLDYGKELRAASRETGITPQLIDFYSDDAEAFAIVNAIAEKLADGVPPKEIMVLLRSSAHGRKLEYALRTYGIKYRLIGGIGFLQASHVKDVVSTLEALAMPNNEISWLRFLMLLPKIGPKTAERLYDPEEEARVPRKEFLQLMADKLASKCKPAAYFIANVFSLDALPDVMLKQVIDFYNNNQILEYKYENWKDRKKDLDILLEIAAKYKTVNRFLEDFKLDPDAEANQVKDNDDLLTLITVHSAKGTEADICFIMRVQPGSYPHYKSETEAEVEEDRRVLYVAMTRARKELYLTTMEDFKAGMYSNACGRDFLSRNVRSRLGKPRGSRYMQYE
ncbi:MAG: ATP-dependent helicase [Victivallales bacterium]|nr:ATP-dependent helicase [Victivallales bacterium]